MFKTRIIEIKNGRAESHFQHSFYVQPRIGEWIDLKTNDLGEIFEVIQVIYSDASEEFDIYVKLVGSQSEALQSLVVSIGNQ